MQTQPGLTNANSLVVDEDEVHVWQVTLNQGATLLERMFSTLAEEERHRARRLRSPKDRDHFVAARGILRWLLSQYVHRPPETLQFAYELYGKPKLAGDLAASDFRFNLAHSNGSALCAVTRGREVGVDLEWMRPGIAREQIAERFFSVREKTALQALPHNLQPQAFFTCWTRKEAYLKATGRGISLPLDRFAVSLTPGEPAALLEFLDDPDEVGRWTLHELRPGPGYVGALAVQGRSGRLQFARWPGFV